MSLPWRERPPEERALLNPALIALLIAQASAGHAQETARGMPLLLSYLVVPIVFHTDTRLALPATVKTSLASWLSDNAVLKAAIQRRVRAFAPLVREGLLMGFQSGAIRLDGSVIEVDNPTAVVPAHDLPELHGLLRPARLVGRIFGRVGSASTVFTMWGVRP
jgi:hypothetical protein